MNDPEAPAAATPGRPLFAALLASMRPKQWSKNALLFMGLIFSRSIGDLASLRLASIGFVVFCALASATYLINDIRDVENDRLHPRKKTRPIAAGELTVPAAIAASAILFAIAMGLSLLVGPMFVAMGLLYVLLTLSYTLRLKHVVIVDVLAIAAGFVLRAVAGAVAISVPISPWLYVVTILGALFLALTKRRQEIVLLEGGASGHRRILEEYTVPMLDQMISVVTSATVIAYSLYTFSAENLPRNGAMMLTLPFLLYGIFRYLYLVHMRGIGGSPEEVLLEDRPMMFTVVGWVLASAAILYLVR